MTRNNMIELIKETLLNLAAPETEDQLRSNITTLLDKLEEAGMTPPAVKESCQTHFVNQLGQSLGVEDSFVFVNRWEDET